MCRILKEMSNYSQNVQLQWSATVWAEPFLSGRCLLTKTPDTTSQNYFRTVCEEDETFHSTSVYIWQIPGTPESSLSFHTKTHFVKKCLKPIIFTFQFNWAGHPEQICALKRLSICEHTWDHRLKRLQTDPSYVFLTPSRVRRVFPLFPSLLQLWGWKFPWSDLLTFFISP